MRHAMLAPLAWSQAMVSTVNTGAPPAWVEVLAPDTIAPLFPDSETTGVTFILLDQQINVGASGRYLHIVKKINNESGVQSGLVYQVTLDGIIASRGGIPLIEDGKLRLTDTVDTWLPELSNAKVLRTPDSSAIDVVHISEHLVR